MHDNLNEILKTMTTIKNEIIRQQNHLTFIHDKVEEGCKLFNEDMPTEAKIAFREALNYSEGLVEDHPGETSFLVILAETQHILALASSYINDFDSAREHLGKAFETYRGIANIDNLYIPILNFSRARIEQSAGNKELAIEILVKNIKAIDDKVYEDISIEGYVYCSGLVLLTTLYYENDQYKKAVDTTRKVIEMKHTHRDNVLNHMPQEYIDMLILASNKAAEADDKEFHHEVLQEGLATCRQAEADNKKVNLLSYGTFYQDLLKYTFFNEDVDKMRPLFEEMTAFCDRYIEQEPKLRRYKISGQLNYAVFCSKTDKSEEAEELICDAISGCTEIKDDDESPEMTLFMVSALNTLSNMQWERGDHQGALRELNRECTILNNYLNRHPDMIPSLSPLLIDLVMNQSRLLYEVGEREHAEVILEGIKESYHVAEEDYRSPIVVIYVMILKKIGDLHWLVEAYEKATKEYQEALYILKSLKGLFPDIAEPLDSLASEIDEILSSDRKTEPLVVSEVAEYRMKM